jgi:hypothetical protein
LILIRFSKELSNLLRDLGADFIEDLQEIYEDKTILYNIKSAVTFVEFKKFLKAQKQTQLLSNISVPSDFNNNIDKKATEAFNTVIDKTVEDQTTISEMEKKIVDAEKKLAEVTKTFESKTKLEELEAKLKKIEEATIEKTRLKHEFKEKETEIAKRLESTKRRKKSIAGNVI